MKFSFLNTLAVAGFGLAIAVANPGDARSQASIDGDAGVSGSIGASPGGVGVGVDVGGAGAETGTGVGTSGATVGAGADRGGTINAEIRAQHHDGATFLAQIGGTTDPTAGVQVIAEHLVAYDQAMEDGNLDAAASALAAAAATAEAEGDLDAQAINQLNAHLGFAVEADVAAELAARLERRG